MRFILLNYGHPAREIHMENVERIVGGDMSVEITYHDGSHLTGYMIRVEQ